MWLHAVWVCVHVSPDDSENASSCLNTEEISSQSSGKTSNSLEPKCLAKFSNAFCTPLNCTSISYRGDRCCEQQVHLKTLRLLTSILHLKQTHDCHTIKHSMLLPRWEFTCICMQMQSLTSSTPSPCAVPPRPPLLPGSYRVEGIRYICDGT